MGVAGRVLVHRNQARHAAAAHKFAAHRMAGPLGRDHDHVDGRRRLDQIEMDVEAMGEGDRGAVADIRRDLVAPDVGLQFVGRAHHHQVGALGGFRHRRHPQPGAFGLLGAGRTRCAAPPTPP
jgi:hypothetical protein